jgi:hypothetical protein
LFSNYLFIIKLRWITSLQSMADIKGDLPVQTKGAAPAKKKNQAKKAPKENQGGKLTASGNVDTKDKSPTCVASAASS